MARNTLLCAPHVYCSVNDPFGSDALLEHHCTSWKTIQVHYALKSRSQHMGHHTVAGGCPRSEHIEVVNGGVV